MACCRSSGIPRSKVWERENPSNASLRCDEIFASRGKRRTDVVLIFVSPAGSTRHGKPPDGGGVLASDRIVPRSSDSSESGRSPIWRHRRSFRSCRRIEGALRHDGYILYDTGLEGSSKSEGPSESGGGPRLADGEGPSDSGARRGNLLPGSVAFGSLETDVKAWLLVWGKNDYFFERSAGVREWTIRREFVHSSVRPRTNGVGTVGRERRECIYVGASLSSPSPLPSSSPEWPGRP